MEHGLKEGIYMIKSTADGTVSHRDNNWIVDPFIIAIYKMVLVALQILIH